VSGSSPPTTRIRRSRCFRSLDLAKQIEVELQAARRAAEADATDADELREAVETTSPA
jgi:hypothetical protein